MLASYITTGSRLELDVGKIMLSDLLMPQGHTQMCIQFYDREPVVTVILPCFALPQHVVHLPPPGNSGTFCSIHTMSLFHECTKGIMVKLQKRVFTSLLCGGPCVGCLFLTTIQGRLTTGQLVQLGFCLSDWNSIFSFIGVNPLRFGCI